MRSLRESKPDVPEALERIIMRSLRVAPDDRYPDLHEMEQELGGFRYALGTAGAVRLGTLVAELTPREARQPTGLQQESGTKPIGATGSDCRQLAAPGAGPSTDTAVLLPEPMHTSSAFAHSPSDWSEHPRLPEATRAMDAEIEGTEIALRAALPMERTTIFAAPAKPNRRKLVTAGAAVVGFLLIAGLLSAVRSSGQVVPVRLTLNSEPMGAKIALRDKDGAFVDAGLVTPAGFDAGVVGESVMWQLDAPNYEKVTVTTRLDRAKILETVKLVRKAPIFAQAQPQKVVASSDAAKSIEPVKNVELAHGENDAKASAKAAKKSRGEVGSVELRVRAGWADIFEGGKRVGQTNDRISAPAGEHHFELRYPNQDRKRVTVVVPANGNVVHTVQK
ncbi:MAG: hypothetical protein H7Z43_03655 [Clostridia bacterium]|nr:hypothetical protein [Deltaproteobacteria bacterium]